MPDYPSAAQVQEYLESYATHFDLVRHIRLGCTVTNITRAEEIGWALTLERKDIDGSAVFADTFDKIYVASGPYAKAHRPHWENESVFQGNIIHAQAYKE